MNVHAGYYLILHISAHVYISVRHTMVLDAMYIYLRNTHIFAQYRYVCRANVQNVIKRVSSKRYT